MGNTDNVSTANYPVPFFQIKHIESYSKRTQQSSALHQLSLDQAIFVGADGLKSSKLCDVIYYYLYYVVVIRSDETSQQTCSSVLHSTSMSGNVGGSILVRVPSPP